MRPRVLVLNTGGTISCLQTRQGLSPEAGIVAQTLRDMPEISHDRMPNYDIIEYEPLLDSTNITMEHWNRLAKDIETEYEHYHGFVILHGTDTLAYTASALSFMLKNLSKPVVITGAQIPLTELRSDGKDNLITALYLAQSSHLHEVVVYFDQRLLRGNRTVKVSAEDFEAFDSPNFPRLARIGLHIEWRSHLLLPKPKQPLEVQLLSPCFIANFRLFPGFAPEVLAHLLTQPLQGLVLETYGSGNAQNNSPQLHQTLSSAISEGLVVVNCSQCLKGQVDMTGYATGQSLREAGVVSGSDMTTEAAHCKLLYLLSHGVSVEDIRSNFDQPWVGECR